jgi:hypothetical protein
LTKQLPLELEIKVSIKLSSVQVIGFVVVDEIEVVVERKYFWLAMILKETTTAITPTRINATINNLMVLWSIFLC